MQSFKLPSAVVAPGVAHEGVDLHQGGRQQVDITPPAATAGAGAGAGHAIANVLYYNSRRLFVCSSPTFYIDNNT